MVSSIINSNSDIEWLISLIDEVFEKLGQEKLFNNVNFTFDEQLFFSDYILGQAKYKEGRILLFFELSAGHIRFDIDRLKEADWSIKWIFNHKQEFMNLLVDIFSCRILVEHKGSRTILRFLEDDGMTKRRWRYSEGFKFNFKKISIFKLYPPFFEC